MEQTDPKVEEAFDLAGQIIGMAMRVHRTLGPGFLESVYHHALRVELDDALLKYETEKSLPVKYQDVVVGDFRADLVVCGQLIVEIKAVQNLVVAHEIQLVNYLAATGIDEGLLLNFGSSSLDFKKKYRVYRRPSDPPPF